MSDTPGIESYPEYLARKGDPALHAAATPPPLESYPEYLARKAAEADSKQVAAPENKAVKGSEGK